MPFFTLSVREVSFLDFLLFGAQRFMWFTIDVWNKVAKNSGSELALLALNGMLCVEWL